MVLRSIREMFAPSLDSKKDKPKKRKPKRTRKKRKRTPNKVSQESQESQESRESEDKPKKKSYKKRSKKKKGRSKRISIDTVIAGRPRSTVSTSRPRSTVSTSRPRSTVSTSRPRSAPSRPRSAPSRPRSASSALGIDSLSTKKSPKPKSKSPKPKSPKPKSPKPISHKLIYPTMSAAAATVERERRLERLGDLGVPAGSGVPGGRSKSPSTPRQTMSGMKVSNSMVGDIPDIGPDIMRKYYNSLSDEERDAKGLPLTSKFKSTFSKETIKKIMAAYNADFVKGDLLNTPEHKALYEDRVVVDTGLSESTPKTIKAIPSRKDLEPGKRQGYRRDGGYDTLGVTPGFILGTLDAESKRLLTEVAAKEGYPISRSKSPTSKSPTGSGSRDFGYGLEGDDIYYYSETYRDWLLGELLRSGNMVSLTILSPDGRRVPSEGDMRDSKFRKSLKGKIYTKEGRKFRLHPINKELKL